MYIENIYVVGKESNILHIWILYKAHKLIVSKPVVLCARQCVKLAYLALLFNLLIAKKCNYVHIALFLTF